jgi:HEAT repeat protein
MGGRIWGTAISCLMLEVYYRYEKFPEVRSLAVTGSIAELARPLLEKFGAGGTAVERAVAMRRLEEELGTGAQAPLFQLLRDSKDLEARQDAAEVLSHLATAAFLSDFLGMLDDPDGVIQERLHRAVARAASPDCVPDLAKRLADDRAHVRFFAARTLGQLGVAAALAPLLERSAVEPDAGVKNEITNAIRALSNRSGLDQLLDDAGFPATDPARRADVREGLRVLENSGLPEKLVAAKTKQPAIYAATLAPLKELGRYGLVPLLIAALELEDVEGRKVADQTLVALAGRGQDFQAEADPKLRKAAIGRWNAWWATAREVLTGLEPAPARR